MGQLISKKNILDNLRLSEGAQFDCNEEAILNEYDKLNENKSSLVIKLLSIIGAFIATFSILILLVFLIFSSSLFGKNNPEIESIVLGIGLITTALIINKVSNKIITDTFSLSTYTVGLGLLAYGLFTYKIDENIILVIISTIAIITLFITQNYMLSFVAVLTTTGSFIYLILLNQFYNLIHLYIAAFTILVSYLFLNESKLLTSSVKISKLYYPFRIGFLISLLSGLVAIGKIDLIPIDQNKIWLSSIILSFVLFYLVHLITKIIEIETLKEKIIVFSITGLILVPTLFSPSILGAIIIVLLSFLANYKTGVAIGIIALVYFISQYYYDLNLTLLTKSIILFSSGIVFLLFYLFTSNKTISNEKV